MRHLGPLFYDMNGVFQEYDVTMAMNNDYHGYQCY